MWLHCGCPESHMSRMGVGRCLPSVGRAEHDCFIHQMERQVLVMQFSASRERQGIQGSLHHLQDVSASSCRAQQAQSASTGRKQSLACTMAHSPTNTSFLNVCGVMNTILMCERFHTSWRSSCLVVPVSSTSADCAALPA